MTMNEAEWFACTDPQMLSRFARTKLNVQRFQYLALRWIVQCPDRRWNDRSQLLERYVEWLHGEGFHPRSLDHIEQAVLSSGASYSASEYETNAAVDQLVWSDDPMTSAALAGSATIDWQSKIEQPYQIDQIQTAQQRHHETSCRFCTEFRDIAGNPFRRVTWQSTWNTETAVALARGIETELAFDRMPILADALQEAGCEEQQVLQHCRNETIHVRGCWVIDSVLGREL